MKKNNYIEEFVSLILELKQEHPTLSIGRHISTAFSDYGDVWDVSDKEIVFALNKYKCTLDLDILGEQSIDKIILDAQDLENILNIDFDEDEYREL